MSTGKGHPTDGHAVRVLRLLTRVVIPALSLPLAACGSGDSVGFCFSDSRPLISNLEITPDLVVVGEGGGTIDANVSFSYQQTDEWIFLVLYNVYDAAGTQVANSDLTTDLRGSGTHSFAIPLDTGRVETYRVTVHVSDRCFEESNLVEAQFQVVEVSGLAGRKSFGTVRLGGLVYAIGGQDADDKVTDEVLRFDPLTERTEPLAPLPEARAGVATAVTDGLIYVFGGEAFGYAQDSTFAYDPTGGFWTVRSPMTHAVTDAKASIVDRSIQIETDSYVGCYVPELDIWADTRCRPK